MSAYSNILTYLLLGHPRPTVDFTGKALVYKYRGPTATLTTNTPGFNDDWNGLPVLRTIGPYQLEKSTISELIVESKTPDFAAVAAAGLAAIGTPEYPLYEVEEIAVQRSLAEHPVFATMSDADWQSLADWTAEPSSADKATYKYYAKDKNGTPAPSSTTLSTTASPTNSAQDYAKLLLQGYSTYTDYYPLARKTQLMYGQDLATVSAIGTKIVGDPFTGVPAGYQWVLSAYRRRKQGRGFHWTVEQEWTGSIKVRVDATAIY